MGWGGRRPWSWQSQRRSRACPGTLGKKQKTRQKTPHQPPASCNSTAKSLQTPWGIGQAKSQGRFWEEIQLPPWLIQNHSTLPSPGPGERPGTQPGTRGRLSGGLWPCPPRQGTACAGALAPGGLCGTSASCPAPAASPPGHLVCVFVRSTLPAGYVRGEECRATLCHEISRTFLG